MARERMDFDVIIVGAGPSGLAAAIRLAQLAKEKQKPLNICVLEKAAEVGGHILAGAVLEPRALNELIPDWQTQGAPVATQVTEDHFLFLTEKRKFTLPLPLPMKNQGNYIISLGLLCRWLGQYAENLGVNIFPGFTATDLLYEQDRICGLVTGSKGLTKAGKESERYQAGMELYAQQIFFAEGCRGSLTAHVMERFHLREACDPQTYGLGFKELWKVPETLHREGSVTHTVGWPLNSKTYGGSFIYHLENRIVALGFVIGLDYENPYLNPYEEFQRFKTHPCVYPLLEKGKRLAYGARALNEGGLQALPKLSFPGGLIIGCAAGFLNVPKIKGIHTAMKSGMLAAESVFETLQMPAPSENLFYRPACENSWIWQELKTVRNIRPAFRFGLWCGMLYAAADTYLFRGQVPWTFHYPPDYCALKKAANSPILTYPKHDQKVTFDLMSSVYLAQIEHVEDQPCHLKLKNPTLAIDVNWSDYASPETRYCPAGVYELIQQDELPPKLQINSANCLHCKACDIKDPKQNIVWTAPEGGSGPQYEMM